MPGLPPQGITLRNCAIVAQFTLLIENSTCPTIHVIIASPKGCWPHALNQQESQRRACLAVSPRWNEERKFHTFSLLHCSNEPIVTPIIDQYNRGVAVDTFLLAHRALLSACFSQPSYQTHAIPAWQESCVTGYKFYERPQSMCVFFSRCCQCSGHC
jgi:hypothetical protein